MPFGSALLLLKYSSTLEYSVLNVKRVTPLMLVAVTSTISSEAMLEMPVEAFMNRSPSLIRLVSHSRPPESSSRSNLGVPLNEVHTQTLI